ncbi:MAG: NifU family protein [Elusimicrobiales bacterium]|jgi:Fe-S cluster biogenesis protein NfuA|nr:NifU family protein [Elusimicrobiales bacterium]NLH40047.1 NifU family protein [Elusimicrobiota bacterium]
MRKKVENIINKIKPMLEADGGSIELVDVDEKKGVVKVKLVGACGACPFSVMTLKNLVEKTIKEEIPEVKEVLSA